MMEFITENLFKPALLIVFSAFLLLIKTRVDKMIDSMISKNKSEEMNMVTTSQFNIMGIIDNAVASVVAGNMPMIEELKNDHDILTADDIEAIHISTFESVYNSLPDDLTNESGTLSKLIGGKIVLDTLITGLIEKHVIQIRAQWVAKG
jgi:hypothetical protein